MVYDAVIIGAGASGMMAAITAAQLNPALKIALIEKNSRVGKKLLSTGNGRCNLTNLDQNAVHYHGDNQWFIQQVLQQFDFDATLSFFRSIGIETTSENGKVFPQSLQAASVLDLIRYALTRNSVECICDFQCKRVKKEKDLYQLESIDQKVITAQKLVIASGGKASPQLGSSGDGYQFLEQFGHETTSLYPSLVQVCTEGKKTLPLKGIKVNAAVKVSVGGEVIASDYGEVLFTEYGLSGPPIFQLSRYASLVKNPIFELDLFPHMTEAELSALLSERRNYFPQEMLLVGLLHNTVCREILREAESSDGIIKLLKKWPFKVTSTRGWNSAQVTGGGVYLRDFSPFTLESKKSKKLYACGEVLDVCGDCGGYNLQWAWSSGAVVGRALAKD